MTAYRLLVADDDRVFREALCEIFEPFFVLLEASCGEEAVALTERYGVDVALLDMHMPPLTGVETIRALKQLHVVAPCILLTADDSAELLASARAADAYSVLHKPVSKSDLVTTVATAVDTAYDDNISSLFAV